MREKGIDGKYIGNAIGYCHCKAHEGALDRKMAYKQNVLLKSVNGLKNTTMTHGKRKSERLRGDDFMAAGVKPMDRKKFVEAITAFIDGRADMKQAAKILGRSEKTTEKYFELVLSGQELPERAFTDELPKK